ncbi:four helix bundle protein [Shewanella putrefaciens]|nr:four helix bundle protein [Shewanella putrefaciens]
MRFEQLDVWKRASRLSCQIYQVTELVSNWGFKDQITRSGLSVPSNIADKSAGATFERCDFSIGLEEVRYMDVPSKVKSVKH